MGSFHPLLCVERRKSYSSALREGISSFLMGLGVVFASKS